MQPRVQPSATGVDFKHRSVAATAGVALVAVAFALQLKDDTRADEIGLGAARAEEAFFQGASISAHRIPDYPSTYPANSGNPVKEGLWVGNSQLFSMMQTADGNRPANQVASEIVGFPVRSLALPNGNPSEHLIVVGWALTRRSPSVLVVPVMFSDLREEGTRAELKELLDAATTELLSRRPVGQALAVELRTRQAEPQGTTETASIADRVEAQLNSSLGQIAPFWRRRGDVLAKSYDQLTKFRNFALGIKRDSKRKILPTILKKHMGALEELLELASERQLKVIVYITPVRHDVEPPYVMAEYDAWKKDVEALAAAHGAEFLNLEHLIPSDRFAVKNGELDFKHFVSEGHVILGKTLAGRLEPSRK